MKGAAESRNCSAALQPLADGRLRQFHGLATDCPLAELTAVWPLLDEWQGAGFLGTRQLERHFQYLALGSLSKAVRVWFDDSLVKLVDCADPALVWADVTALGEPAARMDTSWKGTPIPEGEWVYPQRGLSLHVRPSAQKCFHLLAFAPTALHEFLADFRLIFDLTLRPQRLEEE